MEGFRPFGIPMQQLEPEVLLYEEYESIRLADYDGLNHEEAAKRMNISRPTFTRIYEKARKTVAKAFVEGKAIFFDGGHFHTNEFWYRCEDCYKLTISLQNSEFCCYCQSNNIQRIDQKTQNDALQ